MGIALISSFRGSSLPAARRFEFALAGSLLLHMFIGTAFVLETTLRERPHAGAFPITVRLEPRMRPQNEPLATEAERLHVVRRLWEEGEPIPSAHFSVQKKAEGSRENGAAEASGRRKEVTSVALPQAPDPTYYSARDLDTYPRPVIPLALDRFVVEAVARLRFSVAIDEAGSVREIAVIQTESGERVAEEVRAMLAAMSFIPGRKDGRAVKSRLLFDVTLGPQRREP